MVSHPPKQVQLIWILRQKEEPLLLSWQCHKTQDVTRTCVLTLLNSMMPHCTPWGEGEVHSPQNKDCPPEHTGASSWQESELCSCPGPTPGSASKQGSPALLLNCPTITQQQQRMGGERDCTEGQSQNHPSPSTAKGPWLISFSSSPDASPRYHQHLGSEVALLTQYFTVGAPRFKL